MTGILFVCHGNICRSPMAEFILKDLVKKAGREGEFRIDSAAVSAEELGNPVYPPARRILAAHGIDCRGKTARRTVREDYRRYDRIIAMDGGNLRGLLRVYGGDPEKKLSLLLDWTDHPGDIDDPWYTDDFQSAWDDILKGCKALLTALDRRDDDCSRP